MLSPDSHLFSVSRLIACKKLCGHPGVFPDSSLDRALDVQMGAREGVFEDGRMLIKPVLSCDSYGCGDDTGRHPSGSGRNRLVEQFTHSVDVLT